MVKKLKIPQKNISFPKKLYDDIESQINDGKYYSFSEFVREAVREKLYGVTTKEELENKSKENNLEEDKYLFEQKKKLYVMFKKIEKNIWCYYSKEQQKRYIYKYRNTSIIMVNKAYSLENIVEAEGILTTSDLHGNYELISNSLKTANDENLAVLYNGDVVNDYGFKKLAHSMNIYSGQEIQLDYFASKLGEKDLQTYFVSKQLEQYSLDDMLSQVPKEHQVDAKKSLEEVIQNSKTDLFKKKVEQVEQGFIEEKSQEAQLGSLKLRALYEVFMDEEAKRFAEELNNYSEVSVLFNKGNHENAFFVDQVKQYLDNKEQIIDLTKVEGYTTIKDSKGSETTIAGMTNCSQFMPYLSEIFAPDEISQIYSHMNVDEIKKNSILFGDASTEDVKSRQSMIDLDEDYKRIKSGNLEKKLDIFASHGQIGKPMTKSGNAYDVPYFASAAALSLEANLTLEGHIHNTYNGKNSFGKDMIRAAGNEAAIIKKDENGNLVTSWKKLAESSNGGHSNEIPYDLKYLNLGVEDMLKQYEILLSQQAANDDVSKQSKAA